jgi:hypothetical protein
MVNHFATLLINSNLFSINALRQNYLLENNAKSLITAQEDLFVYNLALNDYYTDVTKSKQFSLFINKDYHELALPTELKKIYNILFPEIASFHYKNFLLYSYLRLVMAVDFNEDILTYDNRITYDLDLFADYFKFSEIRVPKTSINNYQIIVRGESNLEELSEDFNDSFIIRQREDTRQISIFSITQKKYYKRGVPPSSSVSNMYTQLNSANSNLSEIVYVGDSGLSFNITGPLNAFTETANKFWTFTSQAPFNFDFNNLINELELSPQLVESMFAFEPSKCNPKYLNIWKTHYNSVYRLVGLLMAYVERVNFVWLHTKQM